MDVVQPFEFFGLTPQCTLKDVQEAYYRMALLCHPDKGGDPEAMKTLQVAYRWVRDQLTSEKEHAQSFADYYGDVSATETVASFTDVLAETFHYTRDRFKSWCLLHDITSADVMTMLYVPAFEWAMQQKATPDTLETVVGTFLNQFRTDQLRKDQLRTDQLRTDKPHSEFPTETYVPMTHAHGYAESTEYHDADFTVPVANTMVLYQEPHAQRIPTSKHTTISGGTLETDPNHTGGYTDWSKPLPLFDYQEAFIRVDLDNPEDTSLSEFYSLETFESQMEKKKLERAFQDTTIGASEHTVASRQTSPIDVVFDTLCNKTDQSHTYKEASIE